MARRGRLDASTLRAPLLPSIEERLAGRRVALWAAALAVLLMLPSIGAGFVLDDHVHRVAVDDRLRLPGMPSSPFDLFVFVPREAEARRLLVDRAHGPWWAAPDLALAFWRPLASLSHWVDYRLWPDHPAVMHGENLAWLAALVLVAGALYRRLVKPAWIAGLATLLFALDEAHGLPAGWIANRNGLMAATFGGAALVLHDRWRRDGWRVGAVLAPLALLLGLLSAELALATAGFLIAHAIFLDRGGAASRARAHAPHPAGIVGRRVAYVAHRYGARASGVYMDPLRDPLAYAQSLIAGVPLLLGAQLGAPPAELCVFLARPWATVLLVVIAAALVALVAAVMAPRLARDPVTRFFAAGMVLSVIPLCATYAADRLLLITGLGGMGLVAQLLGDWAERRGPSEPPVSGARSRLLAPVGWLLFLVHVVLAPIATLPRALLPGYIAALSRRGMESAPHDAALAGQTLVVVNAADLFSGMYVPIYNAATGRHPPAYLRCLGVSERPVVIERPDERTLVLRPEGGYILGLMAELVRARDIPFAPGDHLDLTGIRYEVDRVTPDGRPAQVTVRFDVPLEDPSLRWIVWNRHVYEPFTPPPVGATMVVDSGTIADLW